MVPIWERINGSAASGGGTPTGLHGTNIESVKVVPGGQAALDLDREHGRGLHRPRRSRSQSPNSGDSQEVKIEVTLTIQQSPTPIVKKQTIDIINPDETKTVVFRDFPSVDFGERRIMRIDVEPVPGETEHRQQLGRVPGHLLARRLMSPSSWLSRSPPRRPPRSRSVPASWLWMRVRRLRAAQRVLLGGGRSDLVDFAVSLQGRIDDLHRAVDEIAAGLSRVDRRVDGSLTNTAVVRYDAYAGTGGHQSASFAFLDANRTGTVVTAIQGRDYARLYVKELDRGRAPIALSPEEQEAVERAMAR